MSSRIAFEGWQIVFPAIGFAVFVLIFILAVIRAVRMKRKSVEHLQQLPLDDESTRPDDNVPLSVRATDDIGVVDLELHIEVIQRGELLEPLAAESPKLGQPLVSHGFDLALTNYELKQGDLLSVRARVALVRKVPPGSTCGYGATHAARGWERWGTLAIGYGDGVPRCLGNRGSALVRGQEVPFVGRTSMDMTVVDITGVPDARVGDAATLIGRDGERVILLDEVASRAGTISYEILTGLRPRLPRVEKGTWSEKG